MEAIIDAAKRGVLVDIIVSGSGARPDNGPSDQLYGNGYDAKAIYKEFIRIYMEKIEREKGATKTTDQKKLDQELICAARSVCTRVDIRFLRVIPHEERWLEGSKELGNTANIPALHDKVLYCSVLRN